MSTTTTKAPKKKRGRKRLPGGPTDQREMRKAMKAPQVKGPAVQSAEGDGAEELRQLGAGGIVPNDAAQPSGETKGAEGQPAAEGEAPAQGMATGIAPAEATAGPAGPPSIKPEVVKMLEGLKADLAPHIGNEIAQWMAGRKRARGKRAVINGKYPPIVGAATMEAFDEWIPMEFLARKPATVVLIFYLGMMWRDDLDSQMSDEQYRAMEAQHAAAAPEPVTPTSPAPALRVVRDEAPAGTSGEGATP